MRGNEMDLHIQRRKHNVGFGKVRWWRYDNRYGALEEAAQDIVCEEREGDCRRFRLSSAIIGRYPLVDGWSRERHPAECRTGEEVGVDGCCHLHGRPHARLIIPIFVAPHNIGLRFVQKGTDLQ